MQVIRRVLSAVVPAVALVAVGASAGTLDPATSPAPTMQTLEDVYQRIDTSDRRTGADGTREVLDGMVLIPEGSFLRGDTFSEGSDDERPCRTLTPGAFYMDQYEIQKWKWDQVYNWAATNGYSFDNAGSGKTNSLPVYNVNWYDCVKWANVAAYSRVASRSKPSAGYASYSHGLRLVRRAQ